MKWNGRRAALSITFDDGLSCQRKWAFPLMETYEIKSTFFLIQNSPFENIEFPHEFWREAARRGHEIGSHSVNHRKGLEMSPEEALEEAIKSREFLQETFGILIDSFCYPYTDAQAHMQEATRKAGYLQARGGRIVRPEKLIGRGEKINQLNLPSLHIANNEIISGELQAKINECIKKECWLILMFHSVGPCKTCTWDNVSSNAFETLMQFLKSKKPQDLWVAPFGTVAKEQRS